MDIDEFSRIAASEELGWQLMDTVHAAEQSIATCVKPVIAMIEGYCVGGGVELALACDLRFGAGKSTFAVPPAKLGLVYSLSSTRLIELSRNWQDARPSVLAQDRLTHPRLKRLVLWNGYSILKKSSMPR